MSHYIKVSDSERLNYYFEGIMIPVEDIAGKYWVPGWQCRRCGWATGSEGYPPEHKCPDDGDAQHARRGPIQV